MEPADVVLRGHQHPTARVSTGRHRGLATLAGFEILFVHPVEQLDRARDVTPGGDHFLGVEPIALDDRAIDGHRVHAVQDHVVRHEVHEDLRQALRVAVSDPGIGFEKRPGPPTPGDPSGWGLYLVEQLADRWGLNRDGVTEVWFEIDRDA